MESIRQLLNLPFIRLIFPVAVGSIAYFLLGDQIGIDGWFGKITDLSKKCYL